jgi:HAD superfamily hydrolase (TIGR01459 family)
MYSKTIESIDEILGSYDSFIIDLWGVVHDGINLYPEALNALNKISNNGGRIVFLSNAPRRKHKVASRLKDFSINQALYHDIVSSGEILFNNIHDHISSGSNKYFYIGYNKDMDILEGTDFLRVYEIEDADFILCADLEEGLTDKISDPLKAKLEQAVKRKVPFLCANPDIYIVLQSGGMQYCAGYIGKYYEELGGSVEYFGKPYPAGYEACKRSLGLNNFEKVIAIGDSFHTDIRGAASNGLDSLLVKCGIHRDVLSTSQGLDNLISEYRVVPTYNIKSFR